MTRKEKLDVYQDVTDRILSALDQGEVPWRKPWAGGLAGAPCNFESKRPYRGINMIITAMAGYSCPYWVTFNQARKMGGQVLKGQKGTRIVAWRRIEKEVENQETGEKEIKVSFFTRIHTVFNLEQTTLADKWEAPEDGEKKEPHEVFTGYTDREKIPVAYLGDRAFYSPAEDRIQLPPSERFKEEAEFHSTAFHEAVHSTGHKGRLDRFKDPLAENAEVASGEAYSKEELVAEIGAAMLCNLTQVDTDKAFSNSVSYIQSWRKRISEDKKLIVTAAQQAAKAVDRILGS